MTEVLIQFFREIFIVFPGAFIRWIFLNRKKTFKEIISEDNIYNYILSFVIIGLIIFVIVYQN